LRHAAAFLLSLVMAKEAIPYRGEGRFLDIGCGGGSYLYRLRQWGWEVHGVEPSRAGVAQARSLGLEVHHGQVRDAQFPDRFFDVIRLHHVLEHLTEPHETFREIARILKPDGLVYITVPNTFSLTFWLFGANWYALDVPRHVISYCPKTLKFLCRAAGFEVVRLRFRSGPFNFVRSVKYYLEESGDGWPDWLRRINWPSNKMIRRTLKPVFFLVDRISLGDVMEATLKKTRQEETIRP
jgi:SAM-dependent methyltransferase